MKKCSKCGSRHIITARAYETITEYNRGVIGKIKRRVLELYPMWQCFECGYGENSIQNEVNGLKEDLK